MRERLFCQLPCSALHCENNLSKAPGEVKSIDGKFFLTLDTDTERLLVGVRK